MKSKEIRQPQTTQYVKISNHPGTNKIFAHSLMVHRLLTYNLSKKEYLTIKHIAKVNGYEITITDNIIKRQNKTNGIKNETYQY